MFTHEKGRIPVAAVVGTEAGSAEIPGNTSIGSLVHRSVLNFYPVFLWVGRIEGAFESVGCENGYPVIDLAAAGTFLYAVVLSSNPVQTGFMRVDRHLINLGGGQVFTFVPDHLSGVIPVNAPVICPVSSSGGGKNQVVGIGMASGS